MDFQEFVGHFDPNLFIPQLKATTREEALSQMVDILAEHKEIKDKNLILQMLLRRENLGSTGIGHGVAIPHGRTLSVSQMYAIFAISKEGIPFDALDGKPVHLIFMIIAPPHEQNQDYLPFLGKLVEILREETYRDQLNRCDNFDQFIDILAGGF